MTAVLALSPLTDARMSSRELVPKTTAASRRNGRHPPDSHDRTAHVAP